MNHGRAPRWQVAQYNIFALALFVVLASPDVVTAGSVSISKQKALEQYQTAKGQARKEYEDEKAQAWRAYQTAKRKAWLSYQSAIGKAWILYESEKALAWKRYLAKTITAKADYDAAAKQAGDEREVLQTRGEELRARTKEDALFNLKTWLQLEFCHSNTAFSLSQLRGGTKGPPSDVGGALAGFLSLIVQTIAPEAERRRIDNELGQYTATNINDIDSRVEQIQKKLGTNDPQKAYVNSWCS